MMYKTDSERRTPLHISCQHNVDHQIIQSLLKLDPYRTTTHMKDNLGFMLIHHACENKDTSVEMINILIDAENRLIWSMYVVLLSLKTDDNTDGNWNKKTRKILKTKKSLKSVIAILAEGETPTSSLPLPSLKSHYLLHLIILHLPHLSEMTYKLQYCPK